MPSKYQCKSCSRSFVHKETLKEHQLLHGLVILDANRFCCPVCQREVTCQSGSHQHGRNYSSIRTRAAELQQMKAKSNSSYNDTALENGVSAHGSSRGEHIKVGLRNKNLKSKETLDADTIVASSNVSCKICNRSFVYHKCLQKHTALVHGLSSEERPRAEVKPDDQPAENVEFSCRAKVRADRRQSATYENCNSVTNSQSVINTAYADDANSILNNAKDSASKPPELAVLGQVGKSTELKISPEELMCKICCKQFKHKAMLLRHLNMVHGEMHFEKCTCPLCLQKFISQWSFSKHFDNEHKTKAVEILTSVAGVGTDPLMSDAADGELDVARCDKCSQWFTCQRSFQKHCLKKHRGDTKFNKFTHLPDLNHQYNDAAETVNTNQEIGSVEGRKLYVDETAYENSEQLISSDSERVAFRSGLSSDNDVQDISDDPLQKSSKYFCSICGKTFLTVNFLDRHIRTKHSNSLGASLNSGGKLHYKARKRTFVCGHCSEEFNEEDALAKHTESYHKGLGINNAECECPLCGCLCPNQTLFSMHYDAVHCANSAMPESATAVLPESDNNLVCRCKVCQLWFTSEEFLQAHRCLKQTPLRQLPKSGRARYRCKHCGEAFEILRRFLHHRKVKHRFLGPDNSHPQPTSVPAADLSSDIAAAAVNGLDATASQHMRGRPPKVDEVQTKHDDGDQKQNEKQQATAKEDSSDSQSAGSTGIRCGECNQLFSTVAQLRRHRKSEHRNRTCQLCGETCKSADMVYYHNLKYHHEQKCEVCGASCSGRLGLIDHFREQHPTEPPPLINRKTLICEYCPRVFASCASRLLRDHIESCHLGRVHLCDVCGKRLGSAQTLAVHRRMHDPVARFECRECNRRFPHNTNLMNHIRKHHPERLPAKYVREFRCSTCQMQFGSSSGLSRHRSEKHGTQRFQCDMCLRVFPSVTSLRVHKRRDHQPKEASTSTSVPPDEVSGTEAESVLPPSMLPPPPQVVAQFAADPTIMAGFMANMIGLPGLGQAFQ